MRCGSDRTAVANDQMRISYPYVKKCLIIAQPGAPLAKLRYVHLDYNVSTVSQFISRPTDVRYAGKPPAACQLYRVAFEPTKIRSYPCVLKDHHIVWEPTAQMGIDWFFSREYGDQLC